MNLLLATLPVLYSSIAILVFRQSALRAGLSGLVLTLCIVAFWPPFKLDFSDASSTLAVGLLNTLNVAYVMLGGVFLFQVLRAGGALEVIAEAVARSIPNPLHSLFALVFGVSIFFESATGFGVGIIVTAPLFIALGYQPVQAAVLALLGQGAVVWGALAIGTVVGADLSGIEENRLGELAVLIGYPFLLLCGAAALSVSGIWQNTRHRPSLQLIWLFVYVTLLSLALWFFTVTTGNELAGCLAGLVVVLFSITINLKHRTKSRTNRLLHAVAPFVLLMLTLLVTRLHQPTRNNLLAVNAQFNDFNFSPFYHAGFWLVLAALSGFIVLPAARAIWKSIFTGTVRQWFWATAAVGGFLMFGQLMSKAGMTHVMAQACATVAGSYYAAVVPFIGGLGGFLTASNTSSNALFMTFQINAATQAGMPVDIAAAVQNASGSNTTLASPGRIVFAASVAGTPGAESALLRKVLPVAVAGVITAMLMSLWLA